MSPSTKVLAWILCIAFGVLLGLGSFTFVYGKGFSYFSNDPKACINCHVMQQNYDSWIKSSHHAVAACNDCHVPHSFPEKWMVKALNGWNHSKAFTLQDFPKPIRIKGFNRRVAENNCLYCHGDLTGEIASHKDVQRGTARCTECHRSVGHMAF